MHINKGISRHVLFRIWKEEAGLLYYVRYLYFLSFILTIRKKQTYLYHTACEQKRALWVADPHFPPLSLSFSLCPSLSHLSDCPLLLPSLGFMCFSVFFFGSLAIYLCFAAVINMSLCHKWKWACKIAFRTHAVKHSRKLKMINSRLNYVTWYHSIIL